MVLTHSELEKCIQTYSPSTEVNLLYGNLYFCRGGSGEDWLDGLAIFLQKNGEISVKVPHHQTLRLRLSFAVGNYIDLIYVPGNALNVEISEPSHLRSLIPVRVILGCQQILEQISRSKVDQWRSLLDWVVGWAKRRGVFGEGFPDVQTLAVMCAKTLQKEFPSFFEAVKYFFHIYESWRFGEGSVASQSGNAEKQGNRLREGQGIESEADEGYTASTEEGSSPREERIPIHKKPRYALAQIRDQRRIMLVGGGGDAVRLHENDLKSGLPSWTESNSLDAIDVMAVIAPFPPHINLAVRVLETQKKLFLQEISRSHMLLADCDGSGRWEDLLLSPMTDFGKSCQIYSVFQIYTSDLEISTLVSAVLEQQLWFAHQEWQGYHGLFVRPFGEPLYGCENLSECEPGWVSTGVAAAMQRAVKTGFTISFVTGFCLVRDQPYGAVDGMQLDLNEPIVKTLLRVRKVLQERPDYDSSFKGRFFVTGGLIRGDLPDHIDQAINRACFHI